MAINAIFPTGVNEITVNGLHQWDYGRTLRIESSDLPSSVEVHFAYPGMRVAIVRACESTRGVAEVTIPDTCLEQTAPITAWVFTIDGTRGRTVKTITIIVTPRAQPQPASFPEEYTDKYTELIDAVEALLTAFKNGEYNDIVAESLVHKSGATMTGPLMVPAASGVYGPDGEYVGFGFYDNDGELRGSVMTTDANCLHFNQQKTGSKYKERYKLPNLPEKEMTKDEWYGVLTTKEPVAVTQGGTGAKTAEEARAKLGVPSRSDLLSGNFKVLRAYQADTVNTIPFWTDKAGALSSYEFEPLDDPTGLLLVEFKYRREGASAWKDGVSVLSIPAIDLVSTGTVCALTGDDGKAVGAGAYAKYIPETKVHGIVETTIPAHITVANFRQGEADGFDAQDENIEFGILSIRYLTRY